MRKKRPGFTLAEVLVALAIIAVLGAILIPALSGKIRDSNTAALLQTFQGYASGVAEFKRATTRYPGSLLNLTTAPVATDKDICGNVLSSTPVSLWRGPYMNRIMLSGGMPIGDAIIQPGARRAVSGTEITLNIDAAGVESSTALDIEDQLDAGNPDYNTGTIRATTNSIGATSTTPLLAAPPAGTYNLSYAIPILGC